MRSHKFFSSLSQDLPWDERLKESCQMIKFAMIKKDFSPDRAIEKLTQETRNVLLDLMPHFIIHLCLDLFSVTDSQNKCQARFYLLDVWSLRGVWVNHAHHQTSRSRTYTQQLRLFHSRTSTIYQKPFPNSTELVDVS